MKFALIITRIVLGWKLPVGKLPYWIQDISCVLRDPLCLSIIMDYEKITLNYHDAGKKCIARSSNTSYEVTLQNFKLLFNNIKWMFVKSLNVPF